MKEQVLESTLVFDGSTLTGKSQKPRKLRVSFRVDSIKGGIDPSRKIQNVEILYASLGVNSSYGGINPSRKYRMLFLFCTGEESTLEEIESTPAQEGLINIYRVNSNTADTF